MHTEEIYRLYAAHTQQWADALDRYSDNAFVLKPSGSDWCMAEVYDHIVQVTAKCLENALACSRSEGETGHSGMGAALFSLMGSFPPIKLKIKQVPSGLEYIYHPQTISRQEARAGLEAALEKMKTAALQVQNSPKNIRVKHWAGGWFNAVQWYHSAEMHLKHHFRQKKRIDTFLQKQGVS